ncbi:MAG: hypothetical protein AAFX78_00115 [Cyanobacteria bacterium J06638_20]
MTCRLAPTALATAIPRQPSTRAMNAPLIRAVEEYRWLDVVVWKASIQPQKAI